MKVLHIIARFNVGGTSTWIYNLSKSLMDNGHETYVVVGGVQSGEVEDERLFQIGGIRLSKLGRKVSLYNDFLALLELRKIIIDIKPDVINTHTAKAGFLGRLANFTLGSKRPALVHTIHGHLFNGYFNFFIVALIIFFEISLSYLTEVMLFPGDKVKNDCLNYKINGQKYTRIVRPGVHIFPKKKSNHEKIVIGWLARFTNIKRPDRAIELARLFPDLDFYFGGDGPLKEEFSKNAPKNCFFLGWQSPEIFWSNCDIALLTSDNEGMPISLIEAQMCGIPCLTTPVGSAPEVVINGVNGYVSDDFEISSLAKCLNNLIVDQTHREKLGLNGIDRAKELFSKQRQFEDHIKAYQLALNIRRKFVN